MQTLVDNNSVWLAGNRGEILIRLQAWCNLYGQSTPVIDLIRLLKQ